MDAPRFLATTLWICTEQNVTVGVPERDGRRSRPRTMSTHRHTHKDTHTDTHRQDRQTDTHTKPTTLKLHDPWRLVSASTVCHDSLQNRYKQTDSTLTLSISAFSASHVVNLALLRTRCCFNGPSGRTGNSRHWFSRSGRCRDRTGPFVLRSRLRS